MLETVDKTKSIRNLPWVKNIQSSLKKYSKLSNKEEKSWFLLSRKDGLAVALLSVHGFQNASKWISVADVQTSSKKFVLFYFSDTFTQWIRNIDIRGVTTFCNGITQIEIGEIKSNGKKHMVDKASRQLASALSLLALGTEILGLLNVHLTVRYIFVIFFSYRQYRESFFARMNHMIMYKLIKLSFGPKNL